MNDNGTDLPDELINEMAGNRSDGRKYNAHDLVLAYVNNHDGSRTNELLVYLYEMQGKVTSRAYLYRIMTRLRAQGLIETRNPRWPVKATHYTTPLGRKNARIYWEPEHE